MVHKTIGATTSQHFSNFLPKNFRNDSTIQHLKIALHQSGIPRFVFCNVFMSHASQEPDFHGSLLLSSVDSRIV